MTHYLSRSLPFVCSPFFLHVFLPHDFSLLWHITGIPFYVLSLCERVLAEPMQVLHAIRWLVAKGWFEASQGQAPVAGFTLDPAPPRAQKVIAMVKDREVIRFGIERRN